MTEWKNRIVGYGSEAPDQLLAHPFNHRVHPKRQQDALGGSLDTLGYIQTVVVNRATQRIIDGHLRVTMALREGQKEIPVTYVELTEAEEAQALLSLDPIAAMAASDADKVDELLRMIQTDDERVMQHLADLAKENGLDYGQAEQGDAEPDTDNIDAILEKWGVCVGDLFSIGEHLLLCGDSTERGNVEKVTQGKKPDCTVTDPPYGVGVDYGTFQDTPENVKELIQKIMPIILDNLPAVFTPGVPAMWDYPRPAWVGSWVHPAPAGGCPWGFVGNNPLLYYGADPYLKAGKGRRPDSIVMASDRQGVDGHPTPKPMKVWEWLVERMTPEDGMTVLDPFGGSGTTLVACQNTRRRARVIELEPKYCALQLERMSTAFPSLEIRRLGESR